MQWAVPDDLKEHTGTDKPVMVHYPHFSTTEIHTDFIDWYIKRPRSGLLGYMY